LDSGCCESNSNDKKCKRKEQNEENPKEEEIVGVCSNLVSDGAAQETIIFNAKIFVLVTFLLLLLWAAGWSGDFGRTKALDQKRH